MNTLAGVGAAAIVIIVAIILFIASVFSTKGAIREALVISYVIFTLLAALMIGTWVSYGYLIFMH